jgi:hypothetical protein
MKLEAYCDVDILENIILDEDLKTNWRDVLLRHSDVCVNLTNDELLKRSAEGSILFEFINAEGGDRLIPTKPFFEELSEDLSKVLNKPRSVFFLDLNEEKRISAINAYGMLIHSFESLCESDLSGVLKKNLAKNQIIESETNFGWKELLKTMKTPMNSLVIQDNYFLADLEIGKSNLYELIDTVLPNELECEFHLTIITKEKDSNGVEVYTKDERNLIGGSIKAKINTLRDYNVKVELVFQTSEFFHERRVLSNYISASSQHGFCIFKEEDKKTCIRKNNLRWDEVFCIINTGSDTEFEAVYLDLKNIKNETDKLAKKIKAKDRYLTGSIVGDINPDKTLSNRLINDIF